MCKRGEIWYVDLGECNGSEQGGERPCLIVQNDIGNKYSPTTIICPLTSQQKTKIPTHVQVQTVKFTSLILCEQIKVINKSRLLRKVYDLAPSDLLRVDKALKISLGVI